MAERYRRRPSLEMNEVKYAHYTDRSTTGHSSVVSTSKGFRQTVVPLYPNEGGDISALKFAFAAWRNRNLEYT